MLEAAQDIWAGYVTHPFVLGLADGSLAVEKFQFYLLQDYVYLFDYAKVFAQGVVKARDPEVMRAFASYVDSILNGEMEIHKGYMARLGISEEQAARVKPSLKNRDPEVMRAFASYVDSILNGEMEIHKGYMARLGISEEQAARVKPSLKNQSYTAYMRAVAAEEGPAEIMAAVLSCALSAVVCTQL